MDFLNDDKKKKLNEFTKFVVKELGIKKPPTIAVLGKRDGLKTTASYDYGKENKVIKEKGYYKIFNCTKTIRK